MLAHHFFYLLFIFQILFYTLHSKLLKWQSICEFSYVITYYNTYMMP